MDDERIIEASFKAVVIGLVAALAGSTGATLTGFEKTVTGSLCVSLGVGSFLAALAVMLKIPRQLIPRFGAACVFLVVPLLLVWLAHIAFVKTDERLVSLSAPLSGIFGIKSFLWIKQMADDRSCKLTSSNPGG
jgi:hypothetical protein